MSYTFANSEGTIVLRDDQLNIPWAGAQPLDMSGLAAKRWLVEGSPVPGAYVPNPPSPDKIRSDAFSADTDRQDIVTAVQNATPTQIRNFVNNNVTDLASAKVMLTKLALLVALTIRN